MYDAIKLRHDTTMNQMNYYFGKRKSFAEHVRNILGAKRCTEINVSKAIKNNELASALSAHLQNEMEILNVEKEYEDVRQIFTPGVYQAFLDEDEDKLREFKKNVKPMHYHHLKGTTKIADYQTCKHLLQFVEKKAQIHQFRNKIYALNDIVYFKSLRRTIKTKKVLKEILKLKEFMTVKEMDNQIKQIADGEKLTKQDLQDVLMMCNVELKKGKNECGKVIHKKESMAAFPLIP